METLVRYKPWKALTRIVNNCHVVSLSVTDCVSATNFNSAKETKLKTFF